MMTSMTERPMGRAAVRAIGAAGLTLLLASCTSTYYRAMESLGVEKRDILIERVEDARDAQEDAKVQFESALDQYRSVVTVDARDLERLYDRMDKEYARSVDQAEAVRDRIDAVESVAGDLFAEWETELGEYSDPDLKRQSEGLLRDTQRQYRSLLTAMHRAEASMDPVLALFHDQVLVLKHSLNARAIGALKNELREIERATATLIADMQRAIDEAGAFIDAMGTR
jgi:hypothetical protein